MAELTLKEYQEGTVKTDLLAVDLELEAGKKDVPTAEKDLEEFEKMIKELGESGQHDAYRDWTLKQQRKSLELFIKRAKLQIEQAQTKREVLTKYEIPKRTKELRDEVEKARSEEMARNATWELQRSTLVVRQRNLTNGARSPLENKLGTEVMKLCQLDATIQSKANETGDSGKPDAAGIEQLVGEFQAQFKQVASLWAQVKAERTENHYKEVRERLNRAARFPGAFSAPPPSAR
jgi:hypothetical protein